MKLIGLKLYSSIEALLLAICHAAETYADLQPIVLALKIVGYNEHSEFTNVRIL